MSKRNKCRTAIFYFDEGRVEFERTKKRDSTNQVLWATYIFIGGFHVASADRRGRYVNRSEAKRLLISAEEKLRKRRRS